MKKFRLKTCDIVFVAVNKEVSDNVTVKGFYCYGMETDNLGIIPFNLYNFYAAGYTNTQQYITVKKRWHILPARICEWLRLSKTGLLIYNLKNYAKEKRNGRRLERF